MKLKYILELFLLSTVFWSCEKAPVSVTATNNPEVRVETLFTHHGCTVYRFEDNGRDHYFTNCQGEVISEHTEGKNRVYVENIPTNKKPCSQ